MVGGNKFLWRGILMPLSKRDGNELEKAVKKKSKKKEAARQVRKFKGRAKEMSMTKRRKESYRRRGR